MNTTTSEIESHERELEVLLLGVMRAPLRPILERVDEIKLMVEKADTQAQEMKNSLNAVGSSVKRSEAAVMSCVQAYVQACEDAVINHVGSRLAAVESCQHDLHEIVVRLDAWSQTQALRIDHALARLDGLFGLIEAQAVLVRSSSANIESRVDGATAATLDARVRSDQVQLAASADLAAAVERLAEAGRTAGAVHQAEIRKLIDGQVIAQVERVRRIAWFAAAVASATLLGCAILLARLVA